MVSFNNNSVNITTSTNYYKMGEETYLIDEKAALVVLDDMYAKLCCEDQTLRTFRRSIGFDQYIKKTLIPLLINAKEEAVIEIAMRILVNLTLPIECLYSVEIMSRTEAGRNNISEICNLLVMSKKCFTDMRTIRAIIDYLKSILEKDSRLSLTQCSNINNCLLLIRNVLHIPENTCAPKTGLAMQNQILWNLFTLSIDKLLIHLMSCPQRGFFCVAIVQLIALMYKDQHISALQKLLNIWFEASLSDSSEDFESNTTPLKTGGSGNSSPMLTSDSSDNGGNMKKVATEPVQKAVLVKPSNTKLPKSKSNYSQSVTNSATETASNCVADSIEMDSCSCKDSGMASVTTSSSSTNSSSEPAKKMSDCGYETQVENSEFISTSSNEDDIPRCHQKPPSTNQKQRYNAMNNPRSAITIHDKKEWRRKKLVKRSKNSLINMKGLLHHTPSDEAISNILKEFTVDLLLKGYGCLVKALHTQLLSQTDLAIQIDTSHFFWLITYFLKFTAQLELDLEHVKSVLSFDIISYLTYEGVNLCEELELLSAQDGIDNKSCLRRMHLVVTAVKEFLHVLDSYKRISHLSTEDRAHIHLLTLQISSTTDLQCLFVLLLRRYNPSIQTKQYLQDVIVTNHILLILLDEASKFSDYRGNLKMLDHIEQFATVEVMHQYGLLLADFQQNGEFVNDCIFTMMHHIGGDIGQVSSLFQPTILKTFSKIFETEYELCDDWSDLIEYIMHKFINTPQKNSLALPRQSLLTDIDMISLCAGKDDNICDVWAKEETDTLYWYYEQSKKSDDVIGSIVKLFNISEYKSKSRIAVIQQLLQQDIITLIEYDDFMKSEDIEYERNTKTPARSSTTDESGIFIRDSSLAERISDDIQVLKDLLLTENKGKSLLWLQKALVDCCFVKLTLKKSDTSKSHFADQQIMEPVPFYYTLKHQSVPVVPWNAEQSIIMLYQPFMLLLHKLGFHLPADSGKMFVRIPEFWTADILYNVAEKLGPVDRSLLKFDLNELTDHHFASDTSCSDHMEETPPYGMNKRNSTIRFTPDPLPQYAGNWLDIARKNSNEAVVIVDCLLPSHTITSATILPGIGSTADQSDPHILYEDPPTITTVPNEAEYNINLSSLSITEEKNRLSDVEECINEDDSDCELMDNHIASNCESASVASDLTQIYDLYVSDEDDT